MKANTFTLHLLGRKEAGVHGDLDTLGEEHGDEAPALIPIVPSLWSGTMALPDRSPGQIPG